MNMLEIPVKLIVKAPNQQVEDQTIHCNLSWTIKRLKGYLSEVYPSKPNTEDQRLIYYGQLLNDSVTLKDVFTRYEAGEETHTVHLVCMPSKETLKMQARKMAEENGNRVRGSNVSVGGSTPANERLSPSESSESGAGMERENSQSGIRNESPAGYQQWVNGLYPQSTDAYNYMQQWAWMQNAYANYYMSQYMDMVARQNGVAFREGYADPRQREPLHNPEPQPAQDVDDDDNRVNRDWLDYFYTLSRLLVLFSIVYFYSSPARFIIVSALGFIMYLYQVGFFRLNPLQGLENNNEVLNNNVPPENNNVMPQGEAPEAAAPERREENAPQNNQNQENGAEPPERPSFIAITWTFVTSFFASMIPETQNAL